MILAAVKFLLLGATLASLCYYIASAIAAHRFFRDAPSKTPRSPLPAATVMVPLCGADFRAYESYAAFCRQDYPCYQLLFGVRAAADSSVAVIRKLIAEFPGLDIELVIGTESIGRNPKVDNLHNMFSKAKHDLIVMVDSDIRVGPDYLARIAAEFTDDRMGLVTCLYRAGAAPSLAARIEAVGITGEFAPGVLIANCLEGIRFAFGATIAVAREKLESIGGFPAIADYLADDYMLGNLMWKAGHKVALSHYVVETMLSPLTFKAMLKHQVRWARGIRACRPAGHTGSIVTYGAALAILYAIVSGGSAGSLLLLGSTLVVRLAAGWFIGVRKLGDELLARNLFLLPVRDVFGFLVWCLSLLGRKVEWRGQVFEIVEGGKLKPLGHAASTLS